MTRTLLALLLAGLISAPGCIPRPREARNDPDAYVVKFETTAGDFLVEVRPTWAPVGARRFLNLVKTGYYDGCRFFRVVPGFVVQWGLNGDPGISAKFAESTISDDRMIVSNTRGTISFAMTSEPSSRTTQVYINYGDNSRLDARRFAPFGVVVEGMEVVDAINAEHGQKPDQGKIHEEGNAYLDREFPGLDYIRSARIVTD